jgi:hypothetical protein
VATVEVVVLCKGPRLFTAWKIDGPQVFEVVLVVDVVSLSSGV